MFHVYDCLGIKVFPWKLYQSENGVCDESSPKRWTVAETFAWRLGQPHMGQIVKWPWRCTTRGLQNSIELWTEKIRQAVTEIWVPQIWQLPGWPPARPLMRPDCDNNTMLLLWAFITRSPNFCLTFPYPKISPNFSHNSLTFPWPWKIFFPDRWQPCVHLWNP